MHSENLKVKGGSPQLRLFSSTKGKEGVNVWICSVSGSSRRRLISEGSWLKSWMVTPNSLYTTLSDIFIYYFLLLYRMVGTMREKISITLDEELVKKLRREAQERNLSLSRLIENKLKEA